MGNCAFAFVLVRPQPPSSVRPHALHALALDEHMDYSPYMSPHALSYMLYAFMCHTPQRSCGQARKPATKASGAKASGAKTMVAGKWSRARI